MHTYKKQGEQWVVGYYILSNTEAGGVYWASGGPQFPQNYPPAVSTWQELSKHDSEQAAIDRVNYLNGGLAFAIHQTGESPRAEAVPLEKDL